MTLVVVMTNLVLIGIVLTIAGLVDGGTRLAGQYGVVFSIFTAVFISIGLFVNLLLALIFIRKKNLALSYLLSSIFYTAVLVLIYFFNRVIA